MPDSAAFELACRRLEEETDLNRLEARGTVRIALKTAGFEPRTISASEMAAVTREVLPAELETRAIANAREISDSIETALSGVADAVADTPVSVFARLAQPIRGKRQV